MTLTFSDSMKITGYFKAVSGNVAWVDTAQYRAFAVGVVTVTGAVSALTIQGSESDSGSNAVTLATHTLSSPAATGGDFVFHEIDINDQIITGTVYRYVSANVTSSGIFAVTYILAHPMVNEAGLTTDIIA
jgi:hypothetical protein